jgi:deazaflavin-dependent oxidoreductase (nitroreductase family)
MGRYSEVRGRRLNPLEVVLERLAQTKAGAWFFVKVMSPLDRAVLHRTHGRLSLSGAASPTGLLVTTGAKTGRRRETPLAYVADGQKVLLVASNGGSPHDPAWAHNLRAHPDCEFLAPKRRGRFQAHEAEGAERQEAWRKSVDRYAGYDSYAERAGRTIPVWVLEPVS